MSPGFEFLIEFKNFDFGEMQKYLRKFPDRPGAGHSHAHFAARVEKEGIYFRDILRSDYSAKIFRMLVELALEFSEVKVNGFGIANIPELPGSLTHLLRAEEDRTQMRAE